MDLSPLWISMKIALCAGSHVDFVCWRRGVFRMRRGWQILDEFIYVAYICCLRLSGFGLLVILVATVAWAGGWSRWDCPLCSHGTVL